MKQGGANLFSNTDEIGGQIVVLANKKLTPYRVEKINLGSVENKIVEVIQVAIGLDVSGFTHEVDNYALYHALVKHGNDPLPLTGKDFIKIPDIIKNPDKIEYEGKTKQGLDAFKYTKRFNGTTYYVEEVRRGNHTLNLKTMYKTKTPSGASLAPNGLGAIRPPQNEAPTPSSVSK